MRRFRFAALCLGLMMLAAWAAWAQQTPPSVLAQVEPTLPPRPTIQPTLPPRPTLVLTLPVRPTLPPTIPPRPTLAPTQPPDKPGPPREAQPTPEPTPVPTPAVLPVAGGTRRDSAGLLLGLISGCGVLVIGASLVLRRRA